MANCYETRPLCVCVCVFEALDDRLTDGSRPQSGQANHQMQFDKPSQSYPTTQPGYRVGTLDRVPQNHNFNHSSKDQPRGKHKRSQVFSQLFVFENASSLIHKLSQATFPPYIPTGPCPATGPVFGRPRILSTTIVDGYNHKYIHLQGPNIEMFPRLCLFMPAILRIKGE